MKTSTKLFRASLLGCAIAACAIGCVPTKWTRQIPENKDFRGRLVSPWGTLEVDTRVNPAGTNPMLPLPVEGGIIVLTNGSILMTQ